MSKSKDLRELVDKVKNDISIQTYRIVDIAKINCIETCLNVNFILSF